MLRQRATLILVTAILATLLIIALSRSPQSALNRAELGARDLLANYGRRTLPNPKLICLAIDSDSVALDRNADLKTLFDLKDENTAEARALTQMSQHWPWPRS